MTCLLSRQLISFSPIELVACVDVLAISCCIWSSELECFSFFPEYFYFSFSLTVDLIFFFSRTSISVVFDLLAVSL